jgi:hypothetical protein
MATAEQIVERLARLRQAERWAKDEMARRWSGREHPSFTAAKVLEEANGRFHLDAYGVDGWSSEDGRRGVDYLNYGDPYEATLLIRSWPSSYRVEVAPGGWGPYAEEE